MRRGCSYRSSSLPLEQHQLGRRYVTLYEYWERLNKLFATCPYHQINEQLLIQYFYDELMLMGRSMIDFASSGTLMDKTLATARVLISNMVGSNQQFGVKGPTASKVVNEVIAANNQRLKNKKTKLTSLVRQLAIEQHHTSPPTKVCDICAFVEHLSYTCSTL
ncbi:hypothetical protein CR513_30834, partial [Mucuna pruriens]